MDPLRIGCLGAARIAPAALIKPARETAGVEAYAIAARDPARAQAFAAKHGVPVVHDSYEALVADERIDAIYNPLPNGLHATWTVKALAAGKHVLCEKPFAANEAEARRVAAAVPNGLVLMEAFHWRYHPLAARVLEIVASGELGEIRHVEAALCFPLPRFKDIRWQFDLAGGALMDAGCYPVSMVRTFAGAEPTVISAVAKEHSPGVDRYIRAELAFGDGRTGRVTASMWSARLLALHATVIGSSASLKVFNPTAPHMYHRLSVGRRHEKVAGRPTYVHQLEAFRAAVREGAPTLTPPAWSIANMAVIDAIYQAAGLPLRPATLT